MRRSSPNSAKPPPHCAGSLGARLATRPAPRCSSTTARNTVARATACRPLRDGQPADPLADPGTADLTAHVDFAAFAAAARAAGAATHGPLPQGMFLARLGLFQRTDRLARTQPPARAAALIEAARRLAEPDRMGRLFKALAVCHPALPDPPGIRGRSADERKRRATPLRRSGRAARFLHPPGRRLRRALCQPQLQPLRPGFADAVLENRARRRPRPRRASRPALSG